MRWNKINFWNPPNNSIALCCCITIVIQLILHFPFFFGKLEFCSTLTNPKISSVRLIVGGPFLSLFLFFFLSLTFHTHSHTHSKTETHSLTCSFNLSLVYFLKILVLLTFVYFLSLFIFFLFVFHVIFLPMSLFYVSDFLSLRFFFFLFLLPPFTQTLSPSPLCFSLILKSWLKN